MGNGTAAATKGAFVAVAAGHMQTNTQAGRHADARDVACLLFAHAEKVGVRNLPEGISAKDFTRQQLDRLELGQMLEVIPWGSKKVKLPPSTLTEAQQKK
jgi:hypothetical protein